MQFGLSIVHRNKSADTMFSVQVAVLGAAGGIGQPLSLLMNQVPLVTELACFDVSPITPGVACDISHNNFACKVRFTWVCLADQTS